MIYIDTHVAIWLYDGKLELFSERAKKEIDAQDLYVSPIVTLELEYLREIERITARPAAIMEALSSELGVRVCELPFATVVDQALKQSWTGDPFDRIIVAHCHVQGVGLITKDQIIRKNFRKACW